VPPDALTLRALSGVPEVHNGDALDDIVLAALAANDIALRPQQALVVCQKIVSKAEGRAVALRTVAASASALERAAVCGKDPRLVELVLRESTAVVRCAPGVLIVRHRLGFVVANAAIDQSNIEGGDEHALLLPADPDASAARLRDALRHRTGVDVAVLVSDSFGRAWRQGVAGVCIGCAGLMPLLDQRGRRDRFGRPLRMTQVAVADQLAAAASLLTGEADEGRPLVHVAGLPVAWFTAAGPASRLVRPLSEDLFQ
jgi:coenzyme F420-0:L-glutamate ligase / coenzyme F420-1:gamma-L-glutamate ligase